MVPAFLVLQKISDYYLHITSMCSRYFHPVNAQLIMLYKGCTLKYGTPGFLN